MENIYPIAKLNEFVLLVHKSDLDYIGKERALEVKCVKVDLERKRIDETHELEKHMKFNPWEEIIDVEERDVVLRTINNKFSDKEISEKIVRPLEDNKIKVI